MDSHTNTDRERIKCCENGWRQGRKGFPVAEMPIQFCSKDGPNVKTAERRALVTARE